MGDAVIESLTRWGLQSAPMHAMPRKRKFYICGVWWDGNELARLLRIQKCRKAERSVSIVDAVSPSVPKNATNRVTFLSVMGNTKRENAR